MLSTEKKVPNYWCHIQVSESSSDIPDFLGHIRKSESIRRRKRSDKINTRPEVVKVKKNEFSEHKNVIQAKQKSWILQFVNCKIPALVAAGLYFFILIPLSNASSNEILDGASFTINIADKYLTLREIFSSEDLT